MELHKILIELGYNTKKILNIEDIDFAVEARHVSGNNSFNIISGELVPEALQELNGQKHQYVLYEK